MAEKQSSIKRMMRLVFFPGYLAAIPLLRDTSKLSARIRKVEEIAKSDSASKKFRIIARQANVGLYAYVSYFLSGTLYALAHDMIPVFDMQSLPNNYLPEDKLGKENAWEYYFKQPFGYSLNDVYSGGYKYTRSHPTIAIKHLLNLPPVYSIKKKEVSPLWIMLYDKFFRLNDETEAHVKKEHDKIIKPGMRVLGVHFRGTDYTAARPKNHPVQPAVDDVIGKVRDVIEQWECDYIYIATEEWKTVIRFEEEFPGRILTIPQEYYDNTEADYTKNCPAETGFNRENDAYLRGLEYLTSIAVFSRCTSAVAGLCTGSMAGLCINGGRFENTYVFDLGLY